MNVLFLFSFDAVETVRRQARLLIGQLTAAFSFHPEWQPDVMASPTSVYVFPSILWLIFGMNGVGETDLGFW